MVNSSLQSFANALGRDGIEVGGGEDAIDDALIVVSGSGRDYKMGWLANFRSWYA